MAVHPGSGVGILMKGVNLHAKQFEKRSTFVDTPRAFLRHVYRVWCVVVLMIEHMSYASLHASAKRFVSAMYMCRTTVYLPIKFDSGRFGIRWRCINRGQLDTPPTEHSIAAYKAIDVKTLKT